MSHPDKPTMDHIAVLLTIFVEDATKLRNVFILHENREPKVDDIVKALKVRAFYGSEFWSRPDIQEKIEETRQYLLNNDIIDIADLENVEDDISDLFSDSDESLEIIEDADIIMADNSNNDICSCDICFKMNNIHLYWDQWNPTEISDKLLKKAINKSAYDGD